MGRAVAPARARSVSEVFWTSRGPQFSATALKHIASTMKRCAADLSERPKKPSASARSPTSGARQLAERRVGAPRAGRRWGGSVTAARGQTATLPAALCDPPCPTPSTRRASPSGLFGSEALLPLPPSKVIRTVAGIPNTQGHEVVCEHAGARGRASEEATARAFTRKRPGQGSSGEGEGRVVGRPLGRCVW